MSSEMKERTRHQEPRRQARGKKRIDELLKAAGEVFQESGYENATTNAIAARARVSPGTLYQFFANKQAIAEALANQYAERNRNVHESVEAIDVVQLPLRELISRLVDPFLEFRRTAPGFDALFTGSVVSPELASRVQALHAQLKHRIARVIEVRVPQLPATTVQAYAETSVRIVKGLMPLALEGPRRQREAGARELKLVLERYLAPLEETKRKQKPGKPRTRQRILNEQ
jgi:AcrR family transcriptional regulator